MRLLMSSMLGLFLLAPLISYSMDYMNIAQELGTYIVWDDSTGTVYDPLEYCISGKDTIYAGAYSMKVPRMAIGTEFHYPFNRVYELPFGQYIFVQRSQNYLQTLLDDNLKCDSCYIPTDDETLDIINEFNITRFSEYQLDSLRQSDVIKYRYAIFLNSQIEKYYLNLEKMTIKQELSYSGENRVIYSKGVKIMLFNIKPDYVEYLTNLVSKIEIFDVNRNRAYVRQKQSYSEPEDMCDSYEYDDSTITIYRSTVYVSPDRMVVPRVRICVPRECFMLGLICSSNSEIFDMPHGQYIMMKRPCYLPVDSKKRSIINDTIYTPSNEEILGFIDDMNIHTYYYSDEDIAKIKEKRPSNYNAGLLSNLYISHYIPDLITAIDECKLSYTGENRIIIKDDIQILLYNILPQKLESLVQLISQIKILKFDDECK